MKKGPLSNKEKEFIDENTSMAVEDICKKLDRSKSIVEKYTKIREDEKTTSTHDLFARKKERGVVVMTESASATADENKKKRKKEMPKRYTAIIHKIKED
jgi:hypothetical protein